MLQVPTGLTAFAEDAGTLYVDPDSLPMPLAELQRIHRSWRRTLKKRLGHRPLVWFVDDEKANREWFVAKHHAHFAVLTFSSRSHFTKALHSNVLCDAVVTDLFFPSNPPRDDEQANDLLKVYSEILNSTVSELPSVWDRWKSKWSLEGFDIACDVAEHAARRREHIPVLLFSRKATLLLSSDDWLVSPRAAVENTHWMLEKLDPCETGEGPSRAARIQRDRITAVLRYRRDAAPWWKKQLGRFSLGWGPVRYSLGSSEKE
jgi:hypothetical protein